MKGIHRSVPALPMSAQFPHTGPSPLPLVPSLLSVPLSSLFYVSILNPLWSKGQLSVWRREGDRDNRKKKWIEKAAKGADLQDSLETSVRSRLSLLPPPVLSPGRGLCAQERLLYLGICGAPPGGWGSTAGLSTSLAARQSAPWAPSCRLDHGGHTHNVSTHPPGSMVRAEARW